MSSFIAPSAHEVVRPSVTASILRSQRRAADYRAQARAASALARASVLQSVRDKHRSAASAWRRLAAFEERLLNPRRRSEPAAPAR
jgi:hypothetical protein